MPDQVNRPGVRASTRARDSLCQLERAPSNRRRRLHLNDVDLDLVARGAYAVTERAPKMNEVVVRREPPETEHPWREVDAVKHVGSATMAEIRAAVD